MALLLLLQVPECADTEGFLNVQTLTPLGRDEGWKEYYASKMDEIDFYRMIYPGKVVRGYHCPPVQQPYWNTIYLADFPEDELYHMIDLAYDTVLNSFSKKVQREILSREK